MEETTVVIFSRKRVLFNRCFGAASRLASLVLGAFWVIFALALWATWINTVRTHSLKEHLDLALFFGSAIVLLMFIFVLTGFEFAYTDLRDKDPTQVRADIQNLLLDMQAHEDLLYETREWIGVLLIVGFAILAEFDVIYIPVVGARNWKFAFSILFTTLPLVWFAQAPAKHVAVANSEKFVQNTRWVWPILKATGRLVRALQLPSVTYVTVEHWIKKKDRRNLAPSNSAFYVSALKKYGYALHDCSELVHIDVQGAVSIEQSGLFHIVSRARTQFKRIMLFSSPVRNGSLGSITAAWHAPAPGERLQDINSEILVAAAEPKNQISLAAFRHKPVIKDNVAEFEIECRPESADDPRALLVEYMFSAASSSRSFKTGAGEEDWYEVTFKFPYRIYSATITLDDQLSTRFGTIGKIATFEGNAHPAEGKRMTAKVEGETGKMLRIAIEFPLPGAVYRVYWNNW